MMSLFFINSTLLAQDSFAQNYVSKPSLAKLPVPYPGASKSLSDSELDSMFNAMPLVRTEKRGRYNYVVGSVLVDAPQDQVWEILADYEKSPEIFANLSLCQVLGTEGEVKLLRQVVKPGGPFKFDYVVNLIEKKPCLIQWKRRSGSLKEVMGTWELKPFKKSASASSPASDYTFVTYSIYLDGGLALPPWLLASQVKGYLPQVLNALKKRVESSNRGRR